MCHNDIAFIKYNKGLKLPIKLNLIFTRQSSEKGKVYMNFLISLPNKLYLYFCPILRLIKAPFNKFKGDPGKFLLSLKDLL